MKEKQIIEIIKPDSQLNLFGFEIYFDLFSKLFKKNKLPNSILISGQKGQGKATFAYHFINFLLSKEEKYNYDKDYFTINPNNSTFKLINNFTHPNLFILDAVNEDSIKIEQVRKLLLFLSKSAYNKGLKIVLIDNAEFLNLNSSNALLKAIEKPSNDTHFFIINNDNKKILNTIKSRCIDFKIYFSFSNKRKIFNEIIKKYDINFTDSDLKDFLHFDSHGNLLNYLSILNNSGYKMSEDYLSCISYLMNLYISKNDPKILNYVSVFVHNFYNKLILGNISLINHYYNNLSKILYLINNMKKFHLDRKNLIFTIDKIIKNER